MDGNIQSARQSPGSRHAGGGKVELLCGGWVWWWGQVMEWVFVPLLRTAPPCCLPEWEWAAPARENICSLPQSAPSFWLQILLGNVLEICNFVLNWMCQISWSNASIYLVSLHWNNVGSLLFVSFVWARSKHEHSGSQKELYSGKSSGQALVYNA